MSATFPAPPTNRMRHPDCPFTPEKCRVTPRHSMQGAPIAWQPEFDGNGVQVGRDPNTYLIDCTCSACGGEWQQSRTGTETTVTVKRAPRPTP